MTTNSTSEDNEASNGWEAAAADVLSYQRNRIGEKTVAEWSTVLQPGSLLLDVGCGFGGSYTQHLLNNEMELFAIDSSPTLLGEYRKRYPQVTSRCEAIEDSSLFARQFHAVLAIGLIFLLDPEQQNRVLQKLASVLMPDGRLLFTAPWQVCDWRDLSTGRKSQSLGRNSYVQTLENCGLHLITEYTDEGENHYFEFKKSAS